MTFFLLLLRDGPLCAGLGARERQKSIGEVRAATDLTTSPATSVTRRCNRKQR